MKFKTDNVVKLLTTKKANGGQKTDSRAYIYIYADESGKGTHFAKSEVKQRDAQMSFVDRKNVENVAFPP